MSEPIGSFQEESDRLNALIDGELNRNSEESSAAPSAEQVRSDSSLLQLEVSVPTQQIGSVKVDAGKEASESITVRATNLTPLYGFNNAYSDFFRAWHGEVSEILSLPDPEHVQPEQRRILREAAEEQEFDIERYLMDFAKQGDDMYFDLAMNYVPFWRKYAVYLSYAEIKNNNTEVRVPKPSAVVVGSGVNRVVNRIDNLSLDAASHLVHSASSFAFTDAEQELLLRIPRKE